jgi:hypothetical protein
MILKLSIESHPRSQKNIQYSSLGVRKVGLPPLFGREFIVNPPLVILADQKLKTRNYVHFRH